jgi:hypothetical protein
MSARLVLGPGREDQKNIPSITDEEVPVIKKLIQAAALLAACSGAAQASTFDFSYTFTNSSTDTPPVITGSFDGTQSGNLFTNISDVSVSVNGVAFNGPLSIGSWDSSAGAVNFTASSAVVSTNGALNNFVIADTNDPSLSTFTNLFYYVSGTTPDQLGTQEVSLQNVAGPSAFDNDAQGGVGTWSVQPVPLPAALPLLVSGLGLFAAAKRRRRETAAA